jgi:hypothetical protein
MKTFLSPLWIALSGGFLTISAAEPVPSEASGSVAQIPEPAFVVPATDVLTSKTVHQNGREVTVRKIRPIALPEPLPAQAPANLSSHPAVQQRATEIQQEHPEQILIQAAATVFRPADSPPFSLVRFWPQGGDAVTFWSSADFAYLSGFTSFAGADGKSYNLLLTWSVSQVRTRMEALAQDDPKLPPPSGFPSDKATFLLVSTVPVPEETRAAIQALHEIYHHEHDRLQAIYEDRQRVELQRQAEAQANPQEKRPVTLNYWRTESPAPPATPNGTAGKGDAR